MESNRQSARLSATHLTAARLRLWVAILIQNELVFKHFLANLAVEHFTEESYQLLYRCVLELYREHEALPTEVELQTELAGYFELDEEIISEAAREELEEFLDYAYDPDTFGADSVTSPKMERFAFKAGKLFLQRRQVESTIETLKSCNNLDTLPALFGDFREASEYLATSEYSVKVRKTMPKGWDRKEEAKKHATGIEFLDGFLGSGAVNKETYGLMAPYGTCKTTIAVMLWVNAAKNARREFLEAEQQRKNSDDPKVRKQKTPKGLSVIVSYEAPLSVELQHRAVMFGARIKRNRLEEMGLQGLDYLSNDPDKPKEYEKKIYQAEIADGQFIPERMRVEQFMPAMNGYTACLDMTGSDPEFPSAGHGGINEIVTRINLELRSRGPEYYVKNVIIDYLALMVDQDNTIEPGSRQEDHKLYQNRVYQVQKEISTRFKCSTWLLQQLSGQANAKLNPTATLHHTDSKGSKSFAENLHFAFVIGNLNSDSVGRIACTKARRQGKETVSIPQLIQVKGEFNDVVTASQYGVDARGNIALKADINAASSQDPQAAAQQGSAASPSSTPAESGPAEEMPEDGYHDPEHSEH